MKALLLLALLTSPALAKDYGKGVTNEPAISLTEAAKQLDSLKEKTVVVKAEIDTVCQMKGCWFTLKDGDTNARVTFNHMFFVPKNSSKKTALVQGKIFQKEISAAEARHYAKDAGLSKKEIEKIKAPTQALWFEASGVRIN